MLFQVELEGSVDAIDALQQEIEQLRRQKAEISALLFHSQQECDALKMANGRLEQQAESLSAPRVLLICCGPHAALQVSKKTSFEHLTLNCAPEMIKFQ